MLNWKFSAADTSISEVGINGIITWEPTAGGDTTPEVPTTGRGRTGGATTGSNVRSNAGSTGGSTGCSADDSTESTGEIGNMTGGSTRCESIVFERIS